MDTTNAWIWYRGMRMHLGKWRNQEWRRTKKAWKKANPEPRDGYICALCHERCNLLRSRTRKDERRPLDFSMDHIIPVSVILDQELDIMLLFSLDNLQATHLRCNGHKGNDTSGNKLYNPRGLVLAPQV